MGTRGLTCVVLDNEFKIAQYGQWDHYIDGQGKTIYNFLKKMKIRDFKNKVRNLKQLTSEEVNDRWKECGADDSGFVDLEISDIFKSKYEHLDRDCGAKVLNLVATGKATDIYLSTDFASDSLFCEWAYVIDLDKKKFEIYQGFQNEPHTGQRFSNFPVEKPTNPGSSIYYPVALIKSYDIKKLPEFETIIKDCAENNEEE